MCTKPREGPASPLENFRNTFAMLPSASVEVSSETRGLTFAHIAVGRGSVQRVTGRPSPAHFILASFCGNMKGFTV